ncbi:MAG TPA: hypothetical protein VKH45_05860 [Candidatus Acidoferrum sp.]|nr:hypothetical protein [Candidatus Acidoferrum sp.]
MRSQGLAKVTGVLFVCLAVCATASAQYGGGGMGGTAAGTGGSSNPNSTGSYSSGSGKAIGIGVGAAAGAAVGIALLVHHHHAAASKEASVVGCTQSMMDGLTLKNEKDDLTYTIVSSGKNVPAGERVELKGVVSDDKSGIHAFRVHSLVNNYGACGASSAMTGQPAEQKETVATKTN